LIKFRTKGSWRIHLEILLVSPLLVVNIGLDLLESFTMKHIVFDCDGTLVDTSTFRYKLFPGIKELLAELSSGNLLYVWTARDRLSTLRILDELGVLQYFDSVSTISDAPPKPHIGGLLTLLGRTTRSSICVIGDSSNDILGAKSFGVLAIGAVWNPATNADYLQGVGADFIVSHPSECSTLIQQNLIGEEYV
jgi:phosphoglycolate phosphatase